MVWKLRRCLPIKYVGPTLNAGESDVAIEEMELAVEGLEIEQV
jgi:phage tail-like protein